MIFKHNVCSFDVIERDSFRVLSLKFENYIDEENLDRNKNEIFERLC